MNEIILALQQWEAARTAPDQLIPLFTSKKGFQLDMSLFPATKPLHAYPGIKEGELGFYVISEEYDVQSTPETLAQHCHWCPCIHALEDGQEIPESEALERIEDWTSNFPQWITNVVPSQYGIYQVFNVPTTSLQPQTYSAFFALKNNVLNPSLKAADLVLKNDANLYFDTIRNEPPFRDPKKYYILELL